MTPSWPYQTPSRVWRNTALIKEWCDQAIGEEGQDWARQWRGGLSRARTAYLFRTEEALVQFLLVWDRD